MARSILPPLTFLTYSLGCRTNQAEIESISQQLMNYGFTPSLSCSPPASLCEALRAGSALILLNTCVVTAKAEKETRQKIRELRKKYPKSFLVVLGCGVTAKDTLSINLPDADLFISNEEKNKTVEFILTHLRHSDRMVSDSRTSVEESLFHATRKGSLDSGEVRLPFARDDELNNKYIQSGRKFIKIQDGCDKFCSFCLTCHLRGKPTSAPPEEIIEEINFWVEKGVKEVILTGINLGLYGREQPCHSGESRNLYNNINIDSRSRPLGLSGMTIVDLVKKILSETKVQRISFSSIYPEMLTEEFIKLVVNNPRISQYFHLSLQSGSQTVLKRMNRKTEVDNLLKTLSKIKADNPLFTFRADIITGFPEETEKEFQETLDFIKETKISFSHIFTYSLRKGTTAYKLINSGDWHEVSTIVKKQRVETLKKAVEEICSNEATKQLNNVVNCLIVRKTPSSFRASKVSRGIPSPRRTKERDPSTSVGMTKDRNEMTIWEGITQNGWLTKIKNQSASWRTKIKDIKGKIVPVKITGFEENYLLGERG